MEGTYILQKLTNSFIFVNIKLHKFFLKATAFLRVKISHSGLKLPLMQYFVVNSCYVVSETLDTLKLLL